MKKSLSLLLSVLLVISSFIGVFTVTTVAAEEPASELITNGNFETNANWANNHPETNKPTTTGTLYWGSFANYNEGIYNGKWLRATGGNAPYVQPDLTYEREKATSPAEAYYFGRSNQWMEEPNDSENHVLRASQNLYQIVDVKENTNYTLKFRFRLPHTETELSNMSVLFGQTKAQSNNSTLFDFSTIPVLPITKMTSAASDGISTSLSAAPDDDDINRGTAQISFPNNDEEWKEVTLNFTTGTYYNDFPDEYGFSQFNPRYRLVLGFAFDLKTAYEEDGKTKITQTKYKYDNGDFVADGTADCTKQAIYFDDISLKECVNPFEDAKFYNKEGSELTNSNEYVGINTFVGGKEVLGLSIGDEVTATPDYNKDCNVFAGWYKDNELFSREEALQFTVNSTDKYYPRFINKNLLTSSAASYENYAAKESLVVTDHTKYPEAGQWGVNFTNGYFRATKYETIYDKDHKSYQQQTTNSSSADTRTVIVDDTKSYKGSKSLKLENNWATLSTGLEVKQHTEYTLTYYVMADGFKDSTTKKLKTHGIATTLNICDSYRPESPDGGERNLGVALGNFSTDNVALVAQTGIDVSNWTKITLSFNSGEFKKLYFVIAPVDSETYWIDEVSLVEKEVPETVNVKFVNADGNNLEETDDSVKNAYVNAHIEEDVFEGTKIATVDYASDAYTFLGWFNANNEKIAATKSYSIKGSAEGIYAKIQINNLLTATASFEGYEVGEKLKHQPEDKDPNGPKGDLYPSGAYFGCNVNAGYLGATFDEIIYNNKGNPITQNKFGTPGSNGISALVKNTEAHSGNKSVYLENNWRTASLGIDVTPKTDYILSYYILAPRYDSTTHQNTIALSAISTTLNTGGTKGENNVSVYPANEALNEATGLYLSKNDLTGVHDGENWIKVTHQFNSMNLNKVYLVIGQTSDNKTGYKDSWAYIDDMTMIKYKKAELTVDMKSCASLDLIDADMDKLYVHQELSFKVINNRNTLPTVKLNDTDVTPDSEGIYTVTLGETNTLSVRFEGDASLNDHDKGYKGEILSKYNEDVYLTSIWEGDTVYQEPALFVEETETKQLLYPVDKIVSLRSYDLKTNYVEGVDYQVVNGKIQRLAGSRIPLYTAPLTTTTKPTQNIFPLKDNENEYLCFIGDTVFPQYAVSVTYEHKTTFANGYTPAAPASQTEKLQKTIEKLKNGEKVNIVIYGDSISTGRSSSGQNSTEDIYTKDNQEGKFANLVINVAPYAPTWIDMFITELRERYPATINLKNLSLGGQDSKWGADNIEKRLALWKDGEDNTITPDLMLIGFGVNDSAGNVEKAAYKSNIKNIISTARSGNPNMEVLLYSPMLPNQRATTWDKEILIGYENALDEIANADEKVGLLKLTSIFTEIIKSKDCVDYLNTNVNHGNDFTARIYATGLLTAMSGESITEYLGTAIRAANGDKKQALRYKFSVSKDLIENGLGGDTLVEYGSIAIPSSYLEGAELIKDGKYKNSKGNIVSPVKGITYSKGGNHTIFAEDKDNNKYIFTAALYNIGYNKTTKTTNYTAWGNDYSVRNYAIFKDANGNTNTVYDATIAVSSVFKVMDQIESAYEFYETNNYLPEGITDAKKLENDYKTVKSILGDANSEQSKAYQAWCNENVNYTPTCTVTADTTDGDAGYVVRVGRSYFAVPYTGNEFIGWYKADKTTPISTDTSLTIANINKKYDGTVVAKFNDKNLLSDIAGAEKLTNVNFKMYKRAEEEASPAPETGNYFYYCHATVKWPNAYIIDDANYVYSGSKAIKIDARTQNQTCIVMRKLEPNTKYRMSFWWKINQPDGLFKTLLVAPMSVNSKDEPNIIKLGGIDGTVTKDPNSDWTYTDFEFTTGAEDTSVKLFYYYDISNGQVPTDTYLYMDELTLNEVAKLYSVTAKAENGVAYKSQLTDSVEGGTSVTFVCSPDNQDAIFNGWYNGETKVSKSQTYTVENVNQNYNLTAKFTKGTEYADTKSGAEITTALQKEGYYDTLFERAIKNKGNQALIANMLKKAQDGGDITVVGLGGSITQGAGSTTPATDSYGQLFANLLQQTFNDNKYDSKVTYKNAGIGSTTSDLGLARMQAQVLDHKPDLVIVDFTTNDQNEERYRYTYEALIRKLMEKQVATIAIMFGSVDPKKYDSADKICSKRDNRTDLHFPSLLYYDIPVIDYYGAMWDYLDSDGNGVSDSDALAQWTKLWNDYIHPNDAGHKLAANAVHYYLNKVLKNIDSISTDPLPEVPQKLFYANTAAYIGSTMYDNSNIGGKLTSSSNFTIADYGNVDANTQSQWKTWKISEGGYIEFTLPSCKSFTILRVQQPNGGKAKITFTDSQTTTWTDNSYQSSGQLNWSSATYYGDGKTPTTILIECLGDGDNTKDTFYQISCVLFAE